MPDFPNELVEAAAKALAGEPRCHCPDDWRADPSPLVKESLAAWRAATGAE